MLGPNQIKRYNWGHQLFRNEIGRQHDVVYYGTGFPKYDAKLSAKDIIKKHCKRKPDIILTYGWRYTLPFVGISEVDDVLKIHIAVDYVSNPPKYNKLLQKHGGYDIIFGITGRATEAMKKHKACERIYLLPFSVDTNIYKKIKVAKKYDVFASYAIRRDIYPGRRKLRTIAKKMRLKVMTKRVVHHQLVRAINGSKIAVTHNNIYKSLSLKYTETLACGTFFLANMPEDLDILGLQNGKHLVIYNDFEDFKDKLEYYLKHAKEREQIANKGMRFVRKNHSCKKRVQQLTQIIKEEFNI
jgi:spore maturation protein CgeB